MRPSAILDESQQEHLRRLIEAGYPQKSCAVRFGLTRAMMFRIVHDLGLVRHYKSRKPKPLNDFKLQDKPLGDWYEGGTGEHDRYLERLREIHGDREKGRHS